MPACFPEKWAALGHSAQCRFVYSPASISVVSFLLGLFLAIHRNFVHMSRCVPGDIQNASNKGSVGLLIGMALLSIVPSAHSAPRYPKSIKDAQANGAKVIKSFPAVSGLTGWVLSENGTYSLVYTTVDKRTLIVGNLFNEKGENLTERYAEKHFPKLAR